MSTLRNRKAPAEEQLELMKDVPASASHAEWDQAFARLIDHCTAINPTSVVQAMSNTGVLNPELLAPLQSSFAIPVKR